jgi:hypothetical protein
VEIAAAPAPLEDCSLGGYRAAPLYEFTAYYGPFAKEQLREQRYESRDGSRDADRNGDAADGHYRLAARCHGAQDTAAFQVRVLSDAGQGRKAAVLDHKGLREALRRFAERSARLHGCGTPTARP